MTYTDTDDAPNQIALAGLSVLHGAEAIHVGPGRRSPARARRRLAPGEEDRVFMGGVPVYGIGEAMEHATKTHQYASPHVKAFGQAAPEAKGDSGTLEAVVSWIVTFRDNISAERLGELCTGIFKGCSDHGDRTTAGRPGLSFLVCRCTVAQLNASLAQTGEEATLAAYDTPVHIGDGRLDYSQYLADRRAATWGLNRINRDAAPAAGRAVHVYVLDTGVRCTHSQFGGRAIPTIESLGTVHKCSCQNTSCANDTHGSCVDILAPGSSIESAGKGSDTQTATKSGTSMACPHVSGAAAILFSLNPSLTPEQILAELLAKAENDAIAGIAGLAAPTVNKLLQVDTLSGNASLLQGARWELIFRQTPGSFRPVSEWLLVNQDTVDKSSGDYSVLQRLEDFRRADGLFDLKLVWPGSAHDDQVWRQSTNPVTKESGGVDGYSAVSAPHTENNWGGLEYNGNYCLLDGSVGHARWFYAVGSAQSWGSGIPGPAAAVDSVELYAWVEDTAPQTWISENGIEVSGTDATAAQFPNASMGGAYIKHGPVPAGVALRTSVPARATRSEYVFYCLNGGYMKVLVVLVSSSGGKLYASAKTAKYQRCPTGTTPGATLANTVADSGDSMQIVKRNFARGYGVFFVKAF